VISNNDVMTNFFDVLLRHNN